MRRFPMLALLFFAGVACGGDGGTAPPTNVDVTGTWTVTMSSFQGHGLQCQINGMTVQLVQTGTTLSGTYSVSDMVCNGVHSGPGSGTIVEGSVIEGALHFHFDTEDFDVHGTVRSTDTASGSFTLVVDVDGTLYAFTGTWTARRQ